MDPTEEQQQAIDLFLSGKKLKIAAFAGTGKTTTLLKMAERSPKSGMYLSFNAEIAAAAQKRFPKENVRCYTTHALARELMRETYSDKKLNESTNEMQLLEHTNYHPCRFGSTLELDDIQQAHLVVKTIEWFCRSADDFISEAHVPPYDGFSTADPAALAEVHAFTVAQANVVWERMKDVKDPLPLGHDGYLKVWALDRPSLNARYVLLDEAQDTNPVMLRVLEDQKCQVVYVGDRHQQIYEWRGAVNAMNQVRDCVETSLTQSFRFGEAIAERASLVLRTLGEPLRLRGNPSVNSQVVQPPFQAKVVLARTNATVIQEALEALNAYERPYIMGRRDELDITVSDVQRIQRGAPARSSLLFGFTSWDAVVAHSGTEEGERLRTLVKLVSTHGASTLRQIIAEVQEKEATATVVLSTTHKAKGREWASVRLANDFASSRSNNGHARNAAVARLFYVGMTRPTETLVVDEATLDLFTSGTREPPAPQIRFSPLPATQQGIRWIDAPAVAPAPREPAASPSGFRWLPIE